MLCNLSLGDIKLIIMEMSYLLFVNHFFKSW